MNTRSRTSCAGILLCLAGLACKTGEDEVIFVTRTNVAIDFDAVPATTDIGYKRDELMLAPSDPNGKVLPLLTSVGTKAGVLEFGANHSFATGEAALVLARYLGKIDDLETGAIKEDEIRTMPDNLISPGTRKRVIFGTNTVMGLGVQWSGGAPSSIALGYKRKELAYIPLEERTGGTTSGAEGGGAPDVNPSKPGLALPSLIATAHGGSKVGGRDSTGVIVGQTFASGHAATLLATHPSVRAALAPAVLPARAAEAAEAAATKAALSAQAVESADADRVAAERTIQEGLVKQIQERFLELTAEQKTKALHRAIELKLIEQGVDVARFQGLIAFPAKGESEQTVAFERLLEDMKNL